MTTQPGGMVFPETHTDGVVNDAVFIAITDSDLYLTPRAHNFNFINPHVVTGPAMYQAG
jgi:hypothetical protein